MARTHNGHKRLTQLCVNSGRCAETFFLPWLWLPLEARDSDGHVGSDGKRWSAVVDGLETIL